MSFEKIIVISTEVSGIEDYFVLDFARTPVLDFARNGIFIRVFMEIKVFNTGIYSVNTLLVHVDEKNVFVVDPAGCVETQDEKIVSNYIKENSLSPILGNS